MRILVLGSSSDNYRELGNIASANKSEYCYRYGYDYLEDNKINYSSYPHPSWSKPDSILKYINLYDWIFWSDVDSLFMNFTIPIERYIDNNFNFIGSYFYSAYLKLSVFHTGNFLIKCDQISEEVLKESLQFISDSHQLREEWGITSVLFNQYRRRVLKLLPEDTFATWVKDSYIIDNKLHEIDWFEWLPYKHGDFINHFGSLIPFKGRVFLMKKYLKLVIK